MKAEIIEHKKGNNQWVTVKAGRKECTIYVSEHYIQVATKGNAVQRAWKSLGKVFHGGFEEARNHYKTEAMQAILIAAHQAVTGGLQIVEADDKGQLALF